jgi:hypothetical protein
VTASAAASNLQVEAHRHAYQLGRLYGEWTACRQAAAGLTVLASAARTQAAAATALAAGPASSTPAAPGASAPEAPAAAAPPLCREAVPSAPGPLAVGLIPRGPAGPPAAA